MIGQIELIANFVVLIAFSVIIVICSKVLRSEKNVKPGNNTVSNGGKGGTINIVSNSISDSVNFQANGGDSVVEVHNIEHFKKIKWISFFGIFIGLVNLLLRLFA